MHANTITSSTNHNNIYKKESWKKLEGDRERDREREMERESERERDLLFLNG